MSDDIALIRNGALERAGDELQNLLKFVFPAEQFEHAIVPAKMNAAAWRKLLRRTPFIGLGWTDLEAKPASASKQFNGTAGWVVFLAVRNVAGVRERFMGDRQGPGLMALVRATVGILHGRTIPKIGSISVLKAANAYADDWDDEGLAMAVVDLTVGTSLPLHGQIVGVDVPDFTSIGANWTFEGAAESPTLEDIYKVGTR